jgi:hypothetical protein
MKLSAVKVARIKKPGRYGDGNGLYLRIAEYPDRNGKPLRSRNWVFRFERDGRERWMGLGPLNTLSLAEARGSTRRQIGRDRQPNRGTSSESRGRSALAACRAGS